MTKRSTLDHRRKELTATMFGCFANRALSKKTTGLDKVAKSMIAKQAPPPAHDPELEHPDEWDRPID